MSVTLYSWSTPNGHKVSIALEEMGLDYRIKMVDIGADEQFAPEFLRISPNNKIPAIVDTNGPDGAEISVFESGAILQYLSEKTGKLGGETPAERVAVREWLFFQVGGFGPMLGQAHHFRWYARQDGIEVPYAIDRYTAETKRLYAVLDRRLSENAFAAGAHYSIADIALWCWANRGMRTPEMQGIDPDDYPNVVRWHREIDRREAVQRGIEAHTQAKP